MLTGREERCDQRCKIFSTHLEACSGSAYPSRSRHRPSAAASLMRSLERAELPRSFLILAGEIAPIAPRRQPIEIGRIAKVKVRAAIHRRIVKDAMRDLEFGHRAHRVIRKHPSVTLTQESDEIRTATVDLCKADRQDRAFCYLLIGNAPAKVDFAPGDAA